MGWGDNPTGAPQGITNMLYERFRQLLSGELKPWELPEFQGVENRLRKTGAMNRRGLQRQMGAAGIRGPAMGLALEKAQEAEMAPMGAAITGAYQQIPSMAMGVQAHLDQLYSAAQDRVLQAYLAKKARGAAWQAQKEQRYKCILASACYGPDSPEVEFLRFYRDHVIPLKIIRGYYVFSDVILPLMKFTGIRKLVKRGLVDPLIRAGLYWMGEGAGLSLPFDMAVTTGFLKFWKILGNRKPYRRKNGEVY